MQHEKDVSMKHFSMHTIQHSLSRTGSHWIIDGETGNSSRYPLSLRPRPCSKSISSAAGNQWTSLETPMNAPLIHEDLLDPTPQSPPDGWPLRCFTQTRESFHAVQIKKQQGRDRFVFSAVGLPVLSIKTRLLCGQVLCWPLWKVPTLSFTMCSLCL